MKPVLENSNFKIQRGTRAASGDSGDDAPGKMSLLNAAGRSRFSSMKSRVVRMTVTLLVTCIFSRTLVCFGENIPGFRQIVAADFARWDSNHDGELSPGEINALIENPQVKGEEAAAVVVIRNIFSKSKRVDTSKRLSRDQLLGFAEDPSVENWFYWNSEEINSCNHALFLPGDPNLKTVQQGQTGDCYLIAVIGALVNSRPQDVQNMIKPLPNNSFEVDFPDGTKSVVAGATDAELIQGAKVAEDHGIWLDILEKAFAETRFGNNPSANGGAAEVPTAEVPRDILSGGKTPRSIERFTGHKVVTLRLDQANGNNARPTVRQIRDLLLRLTREHRVITAGALTRDIKLPPGLVRRHCWAVVGYEPNSQLIRIFNPWGNEFEPKGTPGLANGYAVHHGVFAMPLREFIQEYRILNYETDEPLNG